MTPRQGLCPVSLPCSTIQNVSRGGEVNGDAESEGGIRANVTLKSPTRDLLAAKACVWRVSPFINRMDDAGSDGIELIGQDSEHLFQFQVETQVLVDSVRRSQQPHKRH